ncbi:hypothetical protein HYX04_04935 [Candidatus Woesearchaeota archaeon]|nr:hypothetical protein [Candidatus Woesearchaeota archaeon]
MKLANLYFLLLLLLIIVAGCDSVTNQVNKVAIGLDEEKIKKEYTLQEICNNPLMINSEKCVQFNKQQTQQNEIQEEAIINVNLSKCDDLIDGKDKILCKIGIIVQTGDYKKCSQLPEIYLKLYPRGGCIFNIAINNSDSNLCQKITNDLMKEKCVRYFEDIKKSNNGWDLPTKVGDSSNIPPFLQLINDRMTLREDKIEWWAADFTYLGGRVALPYSNAGKVKIKLNNGEVMDINSGVALYYDDVNDCNGIGICRGISWIYKKFDGNYVGYCPSNQQLCKELSYNYTLGEVR